MRLAASNFNTGGVLFGFTSSTATAADPNDDVNNNDDGDVSGTLGSSGFIVSGPITLVEDGEPGNDGDTDPNTNLTLDFGVVAPAAATLTLGNLVWRDTNNNGQFDPATESGVNGVTVQLLDEAGTVLQTATTAGGGPRSPARRRPTGYGSRPPTGTGPFSPGSQ